MSLTIRQQLVASRKFTYAGTNPCTYITVHETGNANAGANAAAHGNLQARGNSRNASWHYTVDDKEAVQSFPDNVRCWHAGDGRGHGNMSSIAIEICVNRDGDYAKAVANAASLVRTLMARHKIPLANVVQHNRWSGKNCPQNLRSGSKGITWSQFLALVSTTEASNPKPTPAPAPKPTPAPKPAPTGGINMSQLPVIKPGDRGIAVGRMQGLLIANGFDVGKSGIDRSNGPDTQAALRRFQTKYPHTGTGGKPDNSCGPATWRQLLGL